MKMLKANISKKPDIWPRVLIRVKPVYILIFSLIKDDEKAMNVSTIASKHSKHNL